jgi:hypothetical protein
MLSKRGSSFFRFFKAAVSKSGRFPGDFRRRANFSPRYIVVFLDVFLEPKNVLLGEALFSRRKRGFFSRVFADGPSFPFL